MKASICAPSARCTGSWPRTSRCESGAISAVIPATPSPSWWPRAPPDLVLGHHPAPGAQTAGRPSTSMSCSTSSAAASWAGWCRCGRRRARRDADRGNLSQARHRAPGAHPASDAAAPMTSKCTAQLLAAPRVTRSLTPPQVSDDNPFSEAQFKTLKYHPGFPGRFEDITAAIAFCRSSSPGTTPSTAMPGSRCSPRDVHHHRAPDVLAQRGRTLQAAWALHPERFVHGTPKPAPRFPEAVWINPPALPQQEKRVSK